MAEEMANVGETAKNMKNSMKENSDSDAGMQAISRKLAEVYPDQKNHLQATALTKFWLGGPDPLDFISILVNPGDEALGIPQHWHYVSFGFSDLHGDGRVHNFTGRGQQSGFGFELTFRLRKHTVEETAPMWPARLLNSLARYVFQTGSILNCGDHIPWNRPLDSQTQTFIQHMLVMEDPQLKALNTPYGKFQFRQIIGVTETEMKAAQKWKGLGVVGLLSAYAETGGPYCVTDLLRRHSVFDIDPKTKMTVLGHIEKEGSNLGHVTAACQWEDRQGRQVVDTEGEVLDSVKLNFDPDAGELLPIVARGCLKKGKFFVYQNIQGQVIMFVPPQFQADIVFVNADMPIKAEGQTLQIFCSEQFTNQMAHTFQLIEDPVKFRNNFPQEFNFENPAVQITVVPPGTLAIK